MGDQWQGCGSATESVHLIALASPLGLDRRVTPAADDLQIRLVMRPTLSDGQHVMHDEVMPGPASLAGVTCGCERRPSCALPICTPVNSSPAGMMNAGS